MVETYKNWHEKIMFALHGYRNSIRTSTGKTPFSLVYGMDAVLPAEVEILSLRILTDVKFDQLNLIDEKRLKAICHGQLYQKCIKKAHDKKVFPRNLKVGYWP